MQQSIFRQPENMAETKRQLRILVQSVNIYDDEIPWAILNNHPIYQTIHQAALQNHTQPDSLILWWTVVLMLRPADETHPDYPQYQNQINHIASYLRTQFSDTEILPYLTVFEALHDNHDEEQEYAFTVTASADELHHRINTLIQTAHQKETDLLELYVWYDLAIKLGFHNILNGRTIKTYTVNSKGNIIYDDWEFGDFGGMVEQIGDDIVLPPINENLHQKTQMRANEKYQMRKQFEEIYQAIDDLMSVYHYNGLASALHGKTAY